MYERVAVLVIFCDHQSTNFSFIVANPTCYSSGPYWQSGGKKLEGIFLRHMKLLRLPETEHIQLC